MDEKQNAELELFRKITRSSRKSNYHSDINALQKIMNKYLPEIYKKLPDTYITFQDELEQLKEYAAYKQLANKNIVSLCGKYGTGKASFFNSLYGGSILPTDVDPASNVPVYIACGKSSETYVVNNFDHISELTNKDMHHILKGLDTENPDILFTLGHLCKSFLTYASAPTLKHIIFTVLPGYIPENDTNYHPRYNKYELLKKVNRSDAVLWFADIDPKTSAITADDIAILKKIDRNIPKLVIVNKADLYNQADFPEIVEKTQKILNASQIRYIDVLAYSDKSTEKFDKYKMLAYFDRWDKTPEVINFSLRFEKIFEKLQSKENIHLDEFKNALLPEIQKISCNIYNLEKAFMTDEKEGFVPVEIIRSEKTIKSNNPLKNIDLSQVKVSELPIPNPEKLFRSHNDRTQKDSSKYERYINSVSIMMSETMKNITPLFSFQQRNNEYKKNVSSIIASSFGVDMTEPEVQETKETENTKKSEKRSSRSERKSRMANDKETERSPRHEQRTAPQRRSALSQNQNTQPGDTTADSRPTVFKRDNIPERNSTTSGSLPRRRPR